MELVDRFGFSACYNNVKRFVQALRRVEPEQPGRLEHAPGEGRQHAIPKRGPQARFEYSVDGLVVAGSGPRAWFAKAVTAKKPAWRRPNAYGRYCEFSQSATCGH